MPQSSLYVCSCQPRTEKERMWPDKMKQERSVRIRINWRDKSRKTFATCSGIVECNIRTSTWGCCSRLVPSSRLLLRHARLYHVEPERERGRDTVREREMKGRAGARLKDWSRWIRNTVKGLNSKNDWHCGNCGVTVSGCEAEQNDVHKWIRNCFISIDCNEKWPACRKTEQINETIALHACLLDCRGSEEEAEGTVRVKEKHEGSRLKKGI